MSAERDARFDRSRAIAYLAVGMLLGISTARVGEGVPELRELVRGWLADLDALAVDDGADPDAVPF